jgi:small subunit ribosomal protein S7
MVDVLAFGRWSVKDVKVEDPGLQRYVNPLPTVQIKTQARYAGRRFYKSRSFIIERFMNKLMIPGHKGRKHFRSSSHCTGKAHNVYNIMEKALEIIERRTKENPVKVFVKAVENAAPREEIVTVEYGGARYPKAVDCAPQRRVDVALRYFAQGAYDKSFNKKKAIPEGVAEEVVAAYSLDSKSMAISKKNDLERQADGSR